jgi:hypothetical protein
MNHHHRDREDHASMSKFHETRDWSLAEKLAHHSVPANENGCVLWAAQKGTGGYGYLKWKGRSRTVHRLAWESANGPILNGMHVCHKCDVRTCINIDHLFLGTNADNVADKMRKGRQAKGEKLVAARSAFQVCRKGENNGRSKLTDEQVYEIRAMSGMQRDIAIRYGVRRNLVGLIKRRKIWRHLP